MRNFVSRFTNHPVGALLTLMLIFVAIALGARRFGCAPQSEPFTELTPAQPTSDERVHVVKRGEYIVAIAKQYGPPVGYEEMIARNEAWLRARYEHVYVKYSQRYRKGAGRRGHFCNDRLNRPYANTLLPGDELVIPSPTAPHAIDNIVAQEVGASAVLVIDDTGSMNNDRSIVAAWYATAMHSQGKAVKAVVLYSDGDVRTYSADQALESRRTSGQYENTRAALETAAKLKPETIVLVTDEPGDDWNELPELTSPKVVAHCLPDEVDGRYYCEETLQRLARSTNGLRGQHQPAQLAPSAPALGSLPVPCPGRQRCPRHPFL